MCDIKSFHSLHFPPSHPSHKLYPCSSRSSSDSFYSKFGTRKLVPTFFHIFSYSYNMSDIFNPSQTSLHKNSFSSPYFIPPLIPFFTILHFPSLYHSHFFPFISFSTFLPVVFVLSRSTDSLYNVPFTVLYHLCNFLPVLLFFSFLLSRSLFLQFSIVLLLYIPQLTPFLPTLSHVTIRLTLQFSKYSVSLQNRIPYFIFLPAVSFLYSFFRST